MGDTTRYQDAEIRRGLGLPSNAPLNNGVRRMMQIATNKYLQEKSECSQSIFQEYCRLFAQGMQWVHESFPECEGIKECYFGPSGDNQLIHSLQGARRHKVLDTPFVVRNHESTDVYLVIPFEDIRKFNTVMSDSGLLCLDPIPDDYHLGYMTPQEDIFLTGVEEAYHAVQQQRASLRTRLEQEEAALDAQHGVFDAFFAVSGDVAKLGNTDPYELLPRERDVRPIKKQALEWFRNRQRQVDEVLS